jgi:pilus assembly protein Flp/PilA
MFPSFGSWRAQMCGMVELLQTPSLGRGDQRGSNQSERHTRKGPRPDAEQEHHMNNLAKRFVDDESGATAIEYGLIAAGISVAIIAVVNSLGSQLKSTFTNVSSQLATAGK